MRKHNLRNKLPYLLALCCLLHTVTAAVTTPTLELKKSASGMMLTGKLPGGNWDTAQFSLDIFDGKSGKFLPETPQITDRDGCVSVGFAGSDYRWETDFTARGELLWGKSRFTNNSQVEKWIEPALNAKINFLQAPTLFWDGFGKTRPIGSQLLERRGIKGLALEHIGAKELPFPASGVFGSRSGLQLGHLIFDNVSYSAVSYDPAKTTLRFTQRHVVAPGATLEFNWIAGCVNTRCDTAGAAVQQHFDAFPERWAVDQENPYVWGNHAHYLTWKHKPDPEVVRRLKMTCDWAYTPYKRAGDIVCRPELWDYKLRNAPVIKKWLRFGGKRVPMYEISREDFVKMRREEYRKYGKRFGWMFYANCAGTWCEIDLARKLYPDAISDQDPVANHLLKKWSTWHDWEIRVFSMGTSFADAFQRDIRELTAELDLPGFAFDCATGGVSYYGPAVKKPLPGRAWDEKGVFIDQSLAVNHMVDFIHSVRPGMTVFGNGQCKSDMVMFERDFVRTEELAKMMPHYKWYIGSRPSVVHGGGYRFGEVVANWRNLSADEFREVMFKLSVYEMFNQFKYGMGLTFVVQYGAPELVYILPELFELRRAGWRAVVPVTVDKNLYAPYRGAYGKAESSYLFFGNSGTKPSTGEVRVDNGQLTGQSGESVIFVKKLRRGNTLANRIRGGETRFRAILPARVPVLYESVCAIGNAPDKMDLLAKSVKDLDKQIYTVTISKSPEFTGTLKIRNIRGFDGVIKLNGTVVAPAVPVKMRSGDVITAEYTSQLFALKKSDIRNYPFVDKRKNVSCKIWYSSDDPAAAAAAGRIDLFFKFLRKNGIISGKKSVEITHDPALRDAPGVIALDSRASAAGISITPAGTLNVCANGGDALEKTVEKLLDVMDERFPYVFPFAPVSGMPAEVLNHFKMKGKSLPLRKFFE